MLVVVCFGGQCCIYYWGQVSERKAACFSLFHMSGYFHEALLEDKAVEKLGIGAGC